MASELRLTTLANNAGTESVDTTYVINGSAKAWAGGVSDSAVADDSFNVASITDNGTGQNQPNWTNSFGNTGYAMPSSVDDHGDSAFYNRTVGQHSKTTGSVKLNTFTADTAASSNRAQQFIANGDLA